MEFILSGFILIIFVVSLSSLGYFFLNDDSTLNNSKSLHLLFGLSVLLLFSHFSFYLFKLNSLEILIIFLIFSFISIILNLINKKDFLKFIKLIVLFSVPVVSLYLTLAYLYGEQFYVFRGNKWDWFAFVTSTFYLNNLDNLDFLNLKNNFSWDNFENFDPRNHSAYHNNVALWLLKKVNIYLLGSYFININFNSAFLNLYLFKIFSLVLINISVFDFIKKYVNEKKISTIFFLSFVFVCSFWTLYIVEADYYRQLISFSFFIYLICYLDDFFLDFQNKNYKKILISMFFMYSLFLIYTELLFIYLSILFTYYILYDQKIKFLKDNYFVILISLVVLIIIIFPSYNLIIKQIIDSLRSTTGESRWWTYFGAFLFGRSSPALDFDFANEVRNSIYSLNSSSGATDNVSLKDIFFIITSSLSKFNYQNSYLSIIPSLSGFYFTTDLFKFNEKNILNTIFLLVFNLFLIFHITKNLYSVLKTKDSKSKTIKILIFIFLIFSIYFIIKGKLWTFIKLYMYMSPLIFIIILFKFQKIKNNLSIKPNKILVLLMFSFVFYKFYSNNFGITTYDSFPSVQKVEMKKNILWDFKIDEYKNCEKVILDFQKWNYYNPKTIPDRFKSIYLTIKLLENDFKFIGNFELSNQFSLESKKICKVSDFK